ncbi:hypothetical protein TKK_0006544 [Trichogramma kaykai]|uniref:PID domain-containing protein n=1 Tax=Trichogramma kaykai TaxID=54128 RepID=A0ABD2XDX4_9HYME
MALRGRCGKLDVKKSSYYVWYLGAREAKGVQAMPDAIDYLLERERLQEPFKVTLQVSSKGLKIIQTVHPGGSTRQAVKHLVPGHALLAAVQREDVVAATLLLPNPASNNPVHVHAYRCDSVETAELLGGQLKILASHSAESLAARLGVPGNNNNGILGSGNGINGCTTTGTTTTTTNGGGSGSLDSRLQRGSAGNLGSDGRSTRESESSEGSGEHQTNRHLPPIQSTTIYESLAAELRAKLGRGNAAADCDAGPILLPPRDYDTMHRARGNLAGIELRRCLNQTIVGPNVTTTTTATTNNNNNNNNAAGQTTTTSQTQTPVITADNNRPTLATMNTGGGTGGTRSAASSGIGSDSAATPPPYQHHPHHHLNHHNNHHGNHHLHHHGGSSGALCPRPTRPTRDSSSDDDWGHGVEDTDYLSNHHHHHHHHEISPSTTLQHHQHAVVKQSVSLPRLPRSPERSNHAMIPSMKAHHLPNNLHNNHHNLQHHHRGSPGGPAVILSNGTQLPPSSHHQGGGRLRRSLAEHRQRSPSPQYQPRHPAPSDVVSPRERFHDAKEMFRQMEREAIVTGGRNAGVTATPPPPTTRVNGRNESRTLHRSEPVTRQLSHEEPLQAHPQQHQILQRQPPSRQQQFVHHHQHQSPLTQQHQLHQTPPSSAQQQLHERLIRRGAMPHHHVPPPPESPIEPPLQPEISADFRPRARPQRYGAVPAMIQEREPQQEQQQSTSELSRPRPRSFYEVPMAARELRGPRNPIEAREYARGLSSLQNNNNNNNNSNGKQIPPPQPQHPAPQRPRPFTYGELSENERYPGLDRDSARSSMLDSMNSKAQVSTPARYRHSYAEPPRLGLAALHPY